MQTFWDLVNESVIIQGLVTLAVIGTICYLYIVALPVPDALLAFAGAVLMFWFDTKRINKIAASG